MRALKSASEDERDVVWLFICANPIGHRGSDDFCDARERQTPVFAHEID